MTVYRWNNKKIPTNLYLMDSQIFMLKSMKYLEVWTVNSLTRFMIDNMDNPKFYQGRGLKSHKNIKKYWWYNHNRYLIPNIKKYYDIVDKKEIINFDLNRFFQFVSSH